MSSVGFTPDLFFIISIDFSSNSSQILSLGAASSNTTFNCSYLAPAKTALNAPYEKPNIPILFASTSGRLERKVIISPISCKSFSMELINFFGFFE